MSNLKNWQCTIPDSTEGQARIVSFSVSEFEAKFSTLKGSWIKPGNYKALKVGGVLMMSDTPLERRDHIKFIRAAHGNVLINGLGLGCCVKEILAKPEVTNVTVVEKSIDVINLVGPHFPDIKIIHSCAFEYKPTQRYDAVWHDIWPNICTDNLPQMHKLHRKYGKICDWQGSWSRDKLERIRKKTKSWQRS